ncbi:transglycosylase SLT domain-containing protein [Fundidesulfovibrio terrae]|uniref:transglycosylase SLT domain-containing protein n=1 Tax=Fundidesulfovibrio terrae TaxID=2922866 RepID=UPI001FB0430F|nr:transglycosylase SLT domain-containing protein [Fundidesulfovibrio terrae]
MKRLLALAVMLLLASPGFAAESVQDFPMPRPLSQPVADAAGKIAALAARPASPGNALCLGIVQALSKRYPEAVQTLAPLKNSLPAMAAWTGLYLGYAKFRLGDFPGALGELDALPPEDMPFAPEALLLSAYCLEGMGSPQALTRYARFLEQGDHPFRPAALWRGAAVAASSGDFSTAEAYLRELFQAAPWTFSAEKAEPLARELFRSGKTSFDPDSPDSLRGRIETLLDKSQTAKAQPLIARYGAAPGSDPARALYLEGKALYARRDTTAAIQRFEDAAGLFADPLPAAWALYHQARALWRFSGPEDAARMEELLTQCLRRAQTLPDGADLAEASRRLLMLSRLERGRIGDARAMADELAASGQGGQPGQIGQPGTEAREQAAWLSGLLSFAQGDFASAETALATFLAAYPNSDALPGAHYWIARSREAAGDAVQARGALRMVLARWPNGYYGMLAAARLAALEGRSGAAPGAAAALSASPSADAPQAASGIAAPEARPASQAGTDTAQPAAASLAGLSATAPAQVPGACSMLADAPVPPEARAGFDRAGVLEAGLLPELAERELAALNARMPRDPAVALRYARLATSLGSHQSAVRAASRAFQACLWRGTRDELRPLREIVYPDRHQDLIARNLLGTGVDPNIIRGLIRQESFFEPEAVSGAGAVGLMQVMPSTAKTQAEKYGEKGFRPESLRDPAVNIRYGVRYFLERYEEYGGNLALTLASYNAGRVKIGVWREFLGGLDQELFVEFIPYTETREYVKRILGNRAMYAMLY